MQFKKILGQENIKQQLIKTVEENRVSHAQLFLSPEGCGAFPLAVAYAQYINCLQKTNDDSCGECSNCRKYEKYIHPDLHFSFPFYAKHKEDTAELYIEEWRNMLLENPYFDLNTWRSQINPEKSKQANINISECHSIIKKLSYKAFEAETKVLIMWLPEYLDSQGNALLKIIEEPPANTLFILVANNQEKVLSTLLSRTQIVKIKALPNEVISNYLMAEKSLEEAEAHQYSFLADGNLVEAERLVLHMEDKSADLFTNWLRLGYGNKVTDMIAFTDEMSSWGREGQKNFLRYGINFLRECSLLLNGVEEMVKLPPNILETAKKLTTHVLTQNMINALVIELESAHYHVERNANPKILFLDVSLQLVKIIKFKTFPKGTQYILD
ncbi:MAG: hypothetical protein K2Q03_07205 [Sphingobacteriaceae bacterium]|nr:hypothetical protein [Sphingobacteriaceae bacterium]